MKSWGAVGHVITCSCTKTAHPYIFMAIYGIPAIFIDNNNQYEYSKKKYQKWYFLLFFGTFWPFSWNLQPKILKNNLAKFCKKVAVDVKILAKNFGTSFHTGKPPRFEYPKRTPLRFWGLAHCARILAQKPPSGHGQNIYST